MTDKYYDSDEYEPYIEERKQPSKKAKRRVMKKDFSRTALSILIAVGIALLIVNFVAFRSVVDGSSMEPNLHDNDNLIVEKISYYFHDPERFDIIILEPVGDPGELYVKRVIGLPGETVQLIPNENGRFEVWINMRKLDTDIYGAEEMLSAGLFSIPQKLSEDEFFVLGDNRNNSTDSRSLTVGLVKRSAIRGKALFRIWPLSDIGTLE